MLQIQDVCNELNCYIHSMCSTEENLKDYEEKLLEKCFDKDYHIPLGQTTMYYEPPFGLDIKNTQDM
jgi:hypothetical protein